MPVWWRSPCSCEYDPSLLFCCSCELLALPPLLLLNLLKIIVILLSLLLPEIGCNLNLLPLRLPIVKENAVSLSPDNLNTNFRIIWLSLIRSSAKSTDGVGLLESKKISISRRGPRSLLSIISWMNSRWILRKLSLWARVSLGNLDLSRLWYCNCICRWMLMMVWVGFCGWNCVRRLLENNFDAVPEIGDLNQSSPFSIIWNLVWGLLSALVVPVVRWRAAQINLLMVMCWILSSRFLRSYVNSNMGSTWIILLDICY